MTVSEAGKQRLVWAAMAAPVLLPALLVHVYPLWVYGVARMTGELGPRESYDLLNDNGPWYLMSDRVVAFDLCGLAQIGIAFATLFIAVPALAVCHAGGRAIAWTFGFFCLQVLAMLFAQPIYGWTVR